MVQASSRIGLVHHMDGGNLGDDATLAAVAENIKIRWPHSKMVGLPMVREDTRRTLTWPFSHRPASDEAASGKPGLGLKVKIKSLVINTPVALKLLKLIHSVAAAPGAVLGEVRFLARSFRALWSLDFLVISAGGQLTELTGKHRVFRYTRWMFPYTVFKWVALARMARAKPIVLNLAVGQVGGLSKAFLRAALSSADAVSFRDEMSRQQLPLEGLNGRCHVSPDTAYGCNIAALETTQGGARKQFVVGLAPMVFGDPSPVYDSFLRQVGLLGSQLVKHDYCVTLFCTNIGVDSPALCGVEPTIRASVNSAGTGALGRVHQWSTEELLTNMSSMDFIITSRFHGVVFAHILNKPVLAISNDQSVKTLMNELGLSEYCVDSEPCDSNVLFERFMALVNNRDEIKNRMAVSLASFRERLSTEFDEVFPREMRTKLSGVVSVSAPLLALCASLLGAVSDSIGAIMLGS
jgi:polysaccharide pyruvyl transferase WcaK-like protein